MKSVGPNEAPKSKPQVSAPVSVRSRKMLKRTSGSRVRASSERKATSSVGLREGIDEHSKGECERGTPRKVEPFFRSSALGQDQWRKSNGGKADGDVHEEHPAPTECARQESAQNDA